VLQSRVVRRPLAGLLTWNIVHMYPKVKWTYRPNFGPIWFFAWPPGGQNRICKKCCNYWTNGLIISKLLSWVHLVRIHDIVPRILIWPTFQGHRGQSLYGYVSRARFVIAGAIDLNLCTYVLLGDLTSHSDQISVQSDSWLGHLGPVVQSTVKLTTDGC
jgi:hypothetical protein